MPDSLQTRFRDTVSSYGSRFHRAAPKGGLIFHPAFVAWALSFVVECVDFADRDLLARFVASPRYFGATTHGIHVARGLARDTATWALWHEIGHGFDFTMGKDGRRQTRPCAGYSGDPRTAALLSRNASLLCRPPADSLRPAPTSAGELAEWQRAAATCYARLPQAARSYLSSPSELFANAVALAVLNPDALSAIDRELHVHVGLVVLKELASALPGEQVDEIMAPAWRALGSTSLAA